MPYTNENKSGICGEHLTWALEDGTLTIRGEGEMEDYNWNDEDLNFTERPWYSYADSIESVVIEKGVTSIGRRAFHDCKKLTSITIPDGVISIGWGAFSRCTSLTSVTIPNSVTAIGDSAFGNCINLYEFLVDIGNMNYVAENGVLFSKDRRELICYPAGKKAACFTIPDDVISIGALAFDGCTSLTSVIIPDSVTLLFTAARKKIVGMHKRNKLACG